MLDATPAPQIDGWAPCAERYIWKPKETKKGLKEMLDSIVWATREVGAPSQVAPAKDAVRLLVVWKTEKRDGRDVYFTTDKLPMMDDNGTVLTKMENGKAVPRLRYVGPQDLMAPGTRFLPLFGFNRGWKSSTG
jgi:hypothetical protein